MFYLQIASLVVGLIVACLQCGKEAAPVVHTIVEARKHQHNNEHQYNVYRGYDNNYQYWSDSTGTYWCRVNRQGAMEIAEVHQPQPYQSQQQIMICQTPNNTIR